MIFPKTDSRKLIVFLIFGVLLYFGFYSPVGAEQLSFRQPEESFSFIDPVNLSVHRAGERKVAVWDHGLQRFTFFEGRPSNSPANQQNDKLIKAKKIKKWKLVGEMKGIFGGDAKFWCYDSYLAENSEQFPLYNCANPAQIEVMKGPVKNIVAGKNHWLINHPDSPVHITEPFPRGEILKSIPVNLDGSLAGRVNKNLYLYKKDRVFRVFKGKVKSVKKFNNLRAVTVYEDNVYVLTRNNLHKLNQELKPGINFKINGSLDFIDLKIGGEIAYFLAKDGIYMANFNLESYFFLENNPSLNLYELKRAQSAGDDTGVFTKILVESGEILLHGKNRVSTAPTDDFARLRKGENIPFAAKKYFRNSEVFLSDNYLCQFFSTKNELDVYNRKKSETKTISIDSPPDYFMDREFLGRGKEKILFEGKLILPSGKLKKSILFYNLEGEVSRVMTLSHPAGERKNAQSFQYPFYVYRGGDYIYEMNETYIQMYDLKGYPGQIITGLRHPVDLDEYRKQIFVLDRRGRKLRKLKKPVNTRMKFASSFQLDKFEAVREVGPEKYIVTVNDRRSYLGEFNRETSQLERITPDFDQEIKYSVPGQEADKIFFWKQKADTNIFELFSLDLESYQYRSLDFEEKLSGRVYFDKNREVFLVPANNLEDKDGKYIYYDPGEDSKGIIKHSNNLEQIIPAGPTGYTAIIKNNGEYQVVGGELTKSSRNELKWSSEQVYVRSSRPVEQVNFSDRKIYFSLSRENKYTYLFKHPVSEAKNLEPFADLDAYYSGRGRLRWIGNGKNTDDVFWGGENFGRIVRLHTRKLSPGGVSGQLETNTSRDLEGVELLVLPDGVRTTASSDGGFTFDDLTYGYKKIFAPTYHNYLKNYLEILVFPDEYKVNNRASLSSNQELELLDRGVDKENQSAHRRKIYLGTFRELIEEGPLYNRATRSLLEIYKENKNYSKIYDIYKKAPGVFSPKEKYNLIFELITSGQKIISNPELNLIRNFSTVCRGLEEEIISYLIWRQKYISGKKSGEEMQMNRPRLSPVKF